MVDKRGKKHEGEEKGGREEEERQKESVRNGAKSGIMWKGGQMKAGYMKYGETEEVWKFMSSQFHMSYIWNPFCHNSAKLEFGDQAHIQNWNVYTETAIYSKI